MMVRSEMNDGRSVVALALAMASSMRDDVLAALHLLHVPAVGAVARGGVLAQRDVGVVLDRDLVVVVEDDQVAQLLHGRQRRGFGGDALLDVAVGGDHVDEVVERAGSRCGVRIEQPALVARCHRHAHRRGQTLAERAGGDLNALGVPELRVSRRLGSPRAQRLDVGQFQTEPAQVELDVQRQAAVPARQHEPVAAQPVGVAGIVSHRRAGTGCRPAGARLIAVPGCPLPTFWTASAASTRMVSTAAESISDQSSGRCGWVSVEISSSVVTDSVLGSSS